MRGYGRDEVEDYDEYEADGYEGYDQEEEAEEEEYEEEEEKERKPSAEALEYLELRARIKEQIRKRMQRENGSSVSRSLEVKKKHPSDNYGSFFGPSQPVIAQRVIQESKSLLENPHLAFRSLNSNYHDNKTSSTTGTVSKNGVRQPAPKVRNELKTKVQKLKDTRDYSFLLSDDPEVPAPTKQPVPQNVTAPRSEARSAQVQHKSKLQLGNSVRDIRGGRDERKSVPVNGQMHSKSGLQKPTSTSKPTYTSIDSQRQLGSNSGTGPGRPTGPKGLPSKIPLAKVEKKAVAPSKTILPAARKPLPPKMQSAVPKQPIEQRRVSQEPKKSVIMRNQPVTSSEPQINKPVKQISSHGSLQGGHPKKKPSKHLDEHDDDDDEKALAMIRSMFNRRRYDNYDDDSDDSNMEANFDDIMREERRSEKIARKEDEEQLRLIEEEERRERARRLAKKRKLGQ